VCHRGGFGERQGAISTIIMVTTTTTTIIVMGITGWPKSNNGRVSLTPEVSKFDPI